jgi:hypothetical protein
MLKDWYLYCKDKEFPFSSPAGTDVHTFRKKRNLKAGWEIICDLRKSFKHYRAAFCKSSIRKLAF